MCFFAVRATPTTQEYQFDANYLFNDYRALQRKKNEKNRETTKLCVSQMMIC